MPKLWRRTIEEHRLSVHDAILDATWSLVAERGPMAVTMTQIAEAAGIGRATLYKYFPDVQAILVAAHQRHVAGHLERLGELRDGDGEAPDRLRAVLGSYALIAHHRNRHGAEELAALLHRGEEVVRAQQQIVELFRDLLVGAVEVGWLRKDVAPEELASYCLHALSAAGSLPDEAAVDRLVQVTVAGLRPPA